MLPKANINKLLKKNTHFFKMLAKIILLYVEKNSYLIKFSFFHQFSFRLLEHKKAANQNIKA